MSYSRVQILLVFKPISQLKTVPHTIFENKYVNIKYNLSFVLFKCTIILYITNIVFYNAIAAHKLASIGKPRKSSMQRTLISLSCCLSCTTCSISIESAFLFVNSSDSSLIVVSNVWPEICNVARKIPCLTFSENDGLTFSSCKKKVLLK